MWVLLVTCLVFCGETGKFTGITFLPLSVCFSVYLPELALCTTYSNSETGVTFRAPLHSVTEVAEYLIDFNVRRRIHI